MKLFPNPQHIGASNIKNAPEENFRLVRSSLQRRMQAMKTKIIPAQSLGDILSLKINKATKEVTTISKLLNSAALEAETSRSPTMLHATPIAFRTAMLKT